MAPFAPRRRLIATLTVAVLLAAAAPAGALPLRFSVPSHALAGNGPRAVATGDFNGDGDPDLAVADEGSDSVSIFLGVAGGAGFVLQPTPVPAGDMPMAIAVGSFNGGNGDPDLAVANFNANTVSVHYGAAGGSFSGSSVVAVSAGPRAVATGDFDGLNRPPDLAVAGSAVSVLLGAGNGIFTPQPAIAAGTSPSGVAIGDFNQDGDPDLAVANEGTDDVSVLVGGSGVSFSGTERFAAGDAPRAIAAGDFNKDGDPDLAVANQGSDNVSILLGLPGARFAPPVNYPAGDLPRAIATADFNRDGWRDVVVANGFSDDISVLLGAPVGKFSAQTRLPAANGPSGVATADFNNDGEQDIAVASFSADDLSVLVNTTPPTTTLVSGPTGVTRASTPTFEFSADELDVRFECRIDPGAFAPCSSPFTTSPLADGAHVFRVRAIDPAGNVDPSSATRSFTTDTTAPRTSLDFGPASLTRDATPTFGFSSNEPGATFQCRIDEAAFTACRAPFTARLADGAHAFHVRAIDPAGNVDATPPARSFRIDMAAPQTRIAGGPTGRTRDRSPTFRLSASEAGSTFECRIDQAAFAPCRTPFTTATLRRGRHTLQVRATDPAGNRDATPAQRSFTALLTIKPVMGYDWTYDYRSTRVERLVAKSLAAGVRVQVRCSGGGCPFKRKTVKPNRRGTANLVRFFRGAALRPGARIELRFTARDAVGRVLRFEVRSGKQPRKVTRCLAPGARKPSRC